MIIKFLIFLILFVQTRGYYYNDSTFIANIKTDDNFRNYFNPYFDQSLNFLKNLSKSNEIDKDCRSSIARWVAGIEDNELWALKMFESTGKTINGKLNGRNANFGSFDYCIEFDRDEANGVNFEGKYCLASVQTKDSADIKQLSNYKSYQARVNARSRRLIDFNLGNAHGVCLPSTCQIEEIISVFNKKFETLGFTVMPPKRCTTKSEPEPLIELQIFSFAVVLIFVVLCILENFIENDFLSNFSIAKNYNTIYRIDTDEEADSERMYLHGVKFLMIIISISLHSMTLLGPLFGHPYGPIKETIFSLPIHKFLVRSTLFADTMFFFGGFFAMYAFYDVVKTGKIKYNFWNFFMLRYIKIFIITCIILLITIVMPHLGSGPYFSDLTNHFVDNCRANIWKNFLLISNEESGMNMCIIPSWYLSADFQIYIFNYFAIYYLIMRPKLGFLIVIIQMIVVSTFTLIFIHHYNIPVIVNLFDSYLYDCSIIEDTYLHSFYHYNTYTFGIIVAWLVKNKIKPNILRFRLVRIIITVIMFSSLHLLLEYLYYLDKTGSKQNDWLHFFWPIIDKFINMLGPFWIFYSALIGHSTLLKRMFTSKFYVPWSRLSFTLITCQFTYIIYGLSSSRNVSQYNRLNSIKELFSAFLFTFILGNFLYVFFEAPMFNLARSYMGIKRRREFIVNDQKKNV